MAEPLSLGDQLKAKVGDLKQQLIDRHPQMPFLLREIHKTIKQYPEQVTLLDEEEIAVIVSGLCRQTDVEFAAAAQKSRKSTKISAADLGL